MADMLSQEEIDALMSGGNDASDDDTFGSALSDIENDALGEVGNISMGTAATTLFTLLGQKVTITTPRLAETTLKELSDDFDFPLVLIKILYTVGIEGLNLLVLKEKDVAIITDLMMGGDGTNIAEELTELHLSAISEAMNQMIGSSSTSLSEMISRKVDISPPEAFYKAAGEFNLNEVDIDPNETFVKISFKMTVGDLIDSEIMQILPIKVAKQLVSSLVMVGQDDEVEDPINPPKKDAKPSTNASPTTVVSEEVSSEVVMQPQPSTARAAPKPQPVAQVYKEQNNSEVNVQTFEFENFGSESPLSSMASDIGIIRDVPLDITVELGRASKKISDILEFSIGTVIELDKLVGESLDILANGRKIAKGEVVVVDENYGIRITDIIVS